MLGLTIKDDRGKRVRQSAAAAVLAGAGDPGADRVDSRAIRRAAWRWARTPVALFVLLAAAALALAVVGAIKLGPVVIAVLVFSPVAATLILVVSRSVASATESLDSRRIAAKGMMIRSRRCPACAYRLTGIDAESDGCVVCPECGAAWELDAARYSADLRTIVIARDGQVGQGQDHR